MKRFPIQYNSPVVLSFALISLGVLLLNFLTAGKSNILLFCVYRSSLTDPLTYLRFFTHVLGHSSFQHYLGNMTLFLVIGPALEEKYGSRNLLYSIVITAFISGLVQFVLFPGTALLGASGIVFMMILMSSLSGMRGKGIPLTLIVVAVLYLGQEVADAVLVDDNISQLTHIIGGVCGAVLGYALIGKSKN